MKRIFSYIIIVAVAFLGLNSCKKNDDKGKLNIALVSVNKTTLNNNEVLSFIFEINHPTSELTQDTIYMRRKFFTCPSSSGLSKIVVPEYTSTANQAIEYDITFKLGTGDYKNICLIGGTTSKTDSLVYTFWLVDKNGNASDSVTSPKIILKR